MFFFEKTNWIVIHYFILFTHRYKSPASAGGSTLRQTDGRTDGLRGRGAHSTTRTRTGPSARAARVLFSLSVSFRNGGGRGDVVVVVVRRDDGKVGAREDSWTKDYVDEE